MIPVEVKQDISINLPVAEIFTYISDLETMAEWLSPIITATKTSAEETQVGTTLLCDNRFLGYRSEITFEVIEYEPNYCLTLKSISSIAPCLVYYRFEAGRTGGTRFSQEVVIHITESMSAVALPVIRKAMDRQLICDMQMLKDILEAKFQVTT